MRALVVGLGGVGAEVAHTLAERGLCVTAVDYDRLEAINLSRTTGATPADIGRWKAELAYPGVDAIVADVLTLSSRFFQQFDIVISCTDNEESRLFLNEVLIHGVRRGAAQNHAREGDPSCAARTATATTSGGALSLPLWIDVGVVGLDGQLAVLTPDGSCFECLRRVSTRAGRPGLCHLPYICRTIADCIDHALYLGEAAEPRMDPSSAHAAAQGARPVMPPGMDTTSWGRAPMDTGTASMPDLSPELSMLLERTLSIAQKWDITVSATPALVAQIVDRQDAIPATHVANALFAAYAVETAQQVLAGRAPEQPYLLINAGDTLSTHRCTIPRSCHRCTGKSSPGNDHFVSSQRHQVSQGVPALLLQNTIT